MKTEEPEQSYRICRDCQISKPLTSEFFQKKHCSRNGKHYFYNRCKACHNPIDRNIHYKRSYGITYEDKLNLIQQQGGVCYICKSPFKSPKLSHVDHDHRTGKVRAIVCVDCNRTLGVVEGVDLTVFTNYIKEKGGLPKDERLRG